LDAEKLLTPQEIMKEMRVAGYTGDPENIHTILYKAMKRPQPNIMKVGKGLYAHKLNAAVLSATTGVSMPPGS
jgi:hypothetical protein